MKPTFRPAIAFSVSPRNNGQTISYDDGMTRRLATMPAYRDG
jgi:hypothetical protein